MKTSPGSHTLHCTALGVVILFLFLGTAIPATSQENATPEAETAPVPTVSADAVSPEPTESVVDLRDLVLREQQNAPGYDTGSVLSIRGKSDGTVEVRDASGKLLAQYPPNHFVVSGKVSSAAIEKLNARADVLEKALADRKAKEGVEALKEQEAAKKTEEANKQEAKAAEAKWNEDFAAKSAPYLDWKGNTKVNAVKIDAREIREDGTILYEGKSMKPARLWNNKLGQFEMAIPVPAKAE